ncbi:MAG: hypothetical protein GQ557_01435 [Mycoplasmataceae bacterium]|nr:hypothetical protein [Mycoplasmataceae bacterium]
MTKLIVLNSNDGTNNNIYGHGITNFNLEKNNNFKEQPTIVKLKEAHFSDSDIYNIPNLKAVFKLTYNATVNTININIPKNNYTYKTIAEFISTQINLTSITGITMIRAYLDSDKLYFYIDCTDADLLTTISFQTFNMITLLEDVTYFNFSNTAFDLSTKANNSKTSTSSSNHNIVEKNVIYLRFSNTTNSIISKNNNNNIMFALIIKPDLDFSNLNMISENRSIFYSENLQIEVLDGNLNQMTLSYPFILTLYTE